MEWKDVKLDQNGRPRLINFDKVKDKAYDHIGQLKPDWVPMWSGVYNIKLNMYYPYSTSKKKNSAGAIGVYFGPKAKTFMLGKSKYLGINWKKIIKPNTLTLPYYLDSKFLPADEDNTLIISPLWFPLYFIAFVPEKDREQILRKQEVKDFFLGENGKNEKHAEFVFNQSKRMYAHYLQYFKGKL